MKYNNLFDFSSNVGRPRQHPSQQSASFPYNYGLSSENKLLVSISNKPYYHDGFAIITTVKEHFKAFKVYVVYDMLIVNFTFSLEISVSCSLMWKIMI